MSRYYYILAVFAVVFYLAPEANGQLRKIYFTELSCLDHNETICSDLRCGLSEPNYLIKNKNKQKLFNLGCVLQQETTQFNWHMKVIFENSEIRPNIVTMSGDYCDVVNGRIDTGAIQRVALPLIKRFIPSVSHACPYNKNELMEVHEFDGNDIMQLLPRHLSPFGNYTADILVTNDKEEQIIHTFGKFSILKNRSPEANSF